MELNNNGIRGNCESLGARIPVSLCNERGSCEISEDFTLPEYLPEIRRVLRVGAIVSQPSRYLAATSLKLSGTVEYGVLYVGSDGRVYSASLPDDYEMSLPFDDGADRDPDCELSVIADAFACDMTVKVTGARRLNIRSRIGAEARVLGELWVHGGSDLPCENHIQRLVKSVGYSRECFGENSEMEAVDELELPHGERYVCSDCRIFVEGGTAHEGYAECRGTVVMRHVIEKASGELYDISRRIPFDESVEADGMTSGMPVTVSGRCNTIIKSENDAEGEDGAPSVTVSAHICLAVRGYQMLSMSYVKDAFSTAYETENEIRTVELPVLYACGNKNITLGETVSRDALGCPSGTSDSRVLSAVAEAVADGVELSESGRYVINGKCRFYLIFERGDGEEREYFSSDVEVPFRYECAEGGALPTDRTISAQAVDVRARADGDKIDVGCELFLTYSLGGRETVECVDACRMGAELKGKRGGYTVCYPDREESLWSISKKYRVAVDATARGNGIDASLDADSSDLTDGVRYMIV